jgi:ankyrin repeat protein
MNPAGDPVERWRRPSRELGRPLPLWLLLWALAMVAALLPAPWAPLLWWLLAAPFALLLRAVLYPQQAPDRPTLRTAVLALGLVEVGGVALGLWLLGRLLAGAGLPAAQPLALLAGIAGWTLLGRGSAFRPLLALTTPMNERDALSAWTRLRQLPGPERIDAALRVDHLVLAAWLLLPWLLTLPELVQRLPLAPMAYAVFLFPGLALWLVDLDAARLGAAADSDPRPVEATRSVADEPLPDPVIDPDLQLVAAVRRGDVASVHHWLEAGASPDAAPPPGAPDPRNALQSAVAAGSIDLLQLLLRAGADPHRLVHGRHALGEAVRHAHRGHPEMLAALLAAGADPDQPESDGTRPLHHAARLADGAPAMMLLSAGATLDAVSADALTPLGVALQAGNGALAALLLDAGAAIEPPGAVPALHAAVTTADDSVDGLRLLQLRRADFALRDGAGQTALMLAAAANHAAQVTALAGAGCPVAAVDANGRNALMLAAAAGAQRALHALAALAIPVAAVDAGGNSALHHAVSGRADRETVELLLGLGVPTALRNAEGLSAEELAYAHGRTDLARLLAPESSESEPDALGIGLAPPVGGSAVLERGDRLVQACALHRFDLALSLIRQGGLPQTVWVEALLAAGDQLDRPLLDAMLAAGLRIDAMAHPSPQLLLARRLPCPARPLLVLLGAGASVDADDGGDTLLALICGRAEDLAGVSGGDAPPIELLEAVLAAGPALGHRDRDGHLPLHYAIYHRPVAWVQLLLERGADPNAPDRGGRSALHHAVVAPRPDREALLRVLILAGGDPAQPAVDGSNAQGLAAMAGEPLLAGLCDFRTGEHPRYRLRDADVPRAARDGRERLLHKLLELGLPVDARDERQATALIHAAGLGHRGLVETLLARGAQLGLKSDRGVDALAAAVLGGRQEIVALLLDRGAYVNTDYGGMTPVALAASRADPAMLQLLLQRGGRVDADTAEQSPLTLAIRAALRLPDPAPAFACVDALLARHAAVDIRDTAGRTLLLYLCGSGANAPVAPEGPVLLALVARLLAAGADVNATDSYERNAAHWACRHHQPKLLALLLRHGVDTLKPDDMRRLPIDLVSTRRRHEFLEVLDGAGA